MLAFTKDDIVRWKAEIKHFQELVCSIRLTRPERRPGHDALLRNRIDSDISDLQAMIRQLKKSIKIAKEQGV